MGGGASLYFTVAGQDLPGDSLCEYLPSRLDIAPEDDESWRAHLRDLARKDMADDAERWKRIARRSFAGYARAFVAEMLGVFAEKVRSRWARARRVKGLGFASHGWRLALEMEKAA